jgi:hypothetical protein
MAKVMKPLGPQVVKQEQTSNVGEILNRGIQNFGMAVGNVLEQKYKNDLLDANNQITKFNSDYQLSEQQYKSDIAKNGVTDERTKAFRQQRDNLINQYMSSIPSGLRSRAQEQFKTTKYAQDKQIDGLNIMVNEKFQINKYQNNIAGLLNQAKVYGESLDLDSGIENFLRQIGPLRQNGDILLGSEANFKLTMNLESDYASTLLNGALKTNPAVALEALEQNPILKKTLGSDNYEAIKQTALNRQDDIIAWNKKREVVSLIVNDNLFLNEIIGGQKTYAEIEGYIESNKLKPTAADYLRKAGGYEVKKESEAKKINAAKKVEAAAEIEDMILDFSINKDAKMEDLKMINDKIFEHLNSGAFSKTDGMKYLNELKIPAAEILAADSEEYFRNYMGWNVGGIKMIGLVKEIMENAGIEEEEKAKIAGVKYSVYSFYRENLKKTVDDFCLSKGGNLLKEGQPLDPKTVMAMLTDKQKNELFRKAEDETIKNIGKFNYDIEKTEEKTVTQIKQEITNKQNGQLFEEVGKDLGIDIDPEQAKLIFMDNLTNQSGGVNPEFQKENMRRKLNEESEDEKEIKRLIKFYDDIYKKRRR